ncbi:MAG: bca [Haloplasmataceae bacterium]|jgi:hypothetical protein|nr:bca [Haloplasmataceae bacterium]
MRKIIFVFVVMLCLFYFKPIISSANECVPDPKPLINGAHDINFEIDDPKPTWLEGISAIDSCGNEVVVKVDDEDVNIFAVGVYYIHYTAKGNTITFNVRVFEDITKPVITGAESFSIEVNSTIVDYLRNVEVTDNKDTEIEGKLEIDSTKVDLTKVGKYQLEYKAIDYKGNTEIVAVDVLVVDTTFPILENVNHLELEVNQNMNGYDWWSGINTGDNSNLFRNVIDFRNFDIKNIGIYSLTYKVIDDVGNTTEKTIQVSVVDKIKPELVLNQEIKIKMGDVQIDWLNGIDILDNYENIPLSKIFCDTSRVNLEVPGTYKIFYFVSDSSGNYYTLDKDVIVYDDDFPAFHNVLSFNIFVNTEQVDYKHNITVSDPTDGDITDQMIIYDKNVNLSKVGMYKLFYMVTDRSGNRTIETVNVNVYDNEGPVINGTKDLLIEVHTTDFDFLNGVSANDNIDGDLDVEVDFSSVKFNELGNYSIKYTAIDSNNNKTEVIVNVSVVDTTKPVLEGYQDITVLVGTNINLLEHIKAIDNFDGDITSNIELIGTYDINKAGEYQVKIEIEDYSGNYASAYFKLIVKEEHIIKGVDQNTMYYIIAGVGATILVFGFISVISRKRSRIIRSRR